LFIAYRGKARRGAAHVSIETAKRVASSCGRYKQRKNVFTVHNRYVTSPVAAGDSTFEGATKEAGEKMTAREVGQL